MRRGGQRGQSPGPTGARVPTVAHPLTAWSQLPASVCSVVNRVDCDSACLLAWGIKSEFLVLGEGPTQAQGVSMLCIFEMLGSTQGVEGGARRVRQGLTSALPGHSAWSGHPDRKGGARLVA